MAIGNNKKRRVSNEVRDILVSVSDGDWKKSTVRSYVTGTYRPQSEEGIAMRDEMLEYYERIMSEVKALDANRKEVLLEITRSLKLKYAKRHRRKSRGSAKPQ